MSLPPDSFGPEDLAAALPEPLPEEPSSLRNDIVDELADHLRLSLDRELVNTGDEASARRRVLDRFGDPRALARKLWWDALKGRIMRARIWNAGLLLVLCAIVGGMLLLGNTIQSMQRSQAEILAVNRKLHDEFVKKLAELKRDDSAATTQPFAVRVVSGPNRQPVPAEVEAYVDVPGRPNQPLLVRRSTDATGLADFGQLPRGPMRYNVTSNARWQTDIPEFLLGPNVKPVEEVLHPDISPEHRGTLKFDWTVPSEFAGLSLEKLRFLVYLAGPVETLDGRDWWTTDPDKPTVAGASSARLVADHRLLCDAKGQVLGTLEFDWDQAKEQDVAEEAKPRELVAPVRLHAGQYAVWGIQAFSADRLSSTAAEPAVMVELGGRAGFRIEPGKEQRVSLNEKSARTEMQRLWLSVRSLPVWTRDRTVDVVVHTYALNSHFLETRHSSEFGSYLSLRGESDDVPLYKRGDSICLSFVLDQRDDIASRFPVPTGRADFPYSETGLCWLTIESVLASPTRVRVKVNRFQENWIRALESLKSVASISAVESLDIRRIQGFGAQKNEHLERFLREQLATLPAPTAEQPPPE